MSIRCVQFRAHRKNSLVGFADIEFPTIGLVVHECPVHQKNGEWWVSFPSRSYLAADGTTKWVPLIEFAKSAGEARRQFQKQAIAAIHAAAAAQDDDLGAMLS